MAAAMRTWTHEIIEETPSEDAPQVLPEAIRLVALDVRAPYQRDGAVCGGAGSDHRQRRGGARVGGDGVGWIRGVRRSRARVCGGGWVWLMRGVVPLLTLVIPCPPTNQRIQSEFRLTVKITRRAVRKHHACSILRPVGSVTGDADWRSDSAIRRSASS